MIKSLQAQHNILADARIQQEILKHGRTGEFSLVPFQQKLLESRLFPLVPLSAEHNAG